MHQQALQRRRFTRRNSLIPTFAVMMASVLPAFAALSAQAPAMQAPGSLAIHKTVVNQVGSSVTIPALFNTVAHCSANAASPPSHTPIAVPGNQSVTKPGPVAPGIICSVTETPPPPMTKVEGCNGNGASWTVSYSPPVTIVSGQQSVLTVTNTLACDKAPPTGRLSVRKVVVNQVGPSATIPALFNTTTHCSAAAGSPALHTPVGVAAGQTVVQNTAPVAGSICSVTEAPPPPLTKLEACKGRNASWTVSYSAPVTIGAGQASVLTVTNTLECDKPTGGSLQVHKAVVNTLGVPTPAVFTMVASCTGMAPVPLSVAPSQTVTVSNQIPGGTICTVTETLPPQVLGVKACPSGTASWVPTNPGPQPVQVAQTTGMIITNTLTCDKAPATGSLRVLKSVINGTNGPVTFPATFAMKVVCTPSGPTNLPIAVPPGTVGATVSGIAAGSQCVVTEPPLPPMTGVVGCKGGTASWTTVGSPSSATTIPAGGTATVAIRNTLTCSTPPAADCAAPTQSTIGCRVTVTVKRTKGPGIYSVLVSPPATTASPNIAPSTSASCVIGANVMINQTTCWFNYTVNPTSVTLTATSSTGTLPPGFTWSGACSGTSATCVLNASPTQQLVTANYP